MKRVVDLGSGPGYQLPRQPTPTTNMKTLPIVAKFATVTEALAASQMDISYNPEAARQKARETGLPNRHYAMTGPVMQTPDGSIWFTVKCFDGLVVLNRFEPFMSCMDDSPFTLVTITEDEIQIHEALTFPKSARKALAKIDGLVVR